MVAITFIDDAGEARRVDVEPGYSVMEAAVNNGVPGIIGECGGFAACGTCVAFVADAWREATGTPDEAEREMLDFLDLPGAGEGARLTCQIRISEALDGLTVTTPPAA